MPILGNFTYIRFAVIASILLVHLDSPPSSFPQSAGKSGDFETLAANASSAREAGRVDEAVHNYRAAVELRPAWDEGWWYLGTLLYDGNHFEEAVPALRQVVALDPRVGAGWAFLGLCEFETGDYPDAFTHLQTANQLGFADSPDVEKVASYHLALLFNLHGQFERATELLGSAFGGNPFPEQIKTALGLALLRAPVLPAQLNPAKDALVHAAGETAALIAYHETAGALANFEQMLRDYPGTPYLHYEYGIVLAAASQDERAKLQFREEIQTAPRTALPWIAIANLEMRAKNNKEAVSAAQRATEIVPYSAVAYEILGRSLLTDGNQQAAAEASQRALDLAKQPIELDQEQVSRYALSKDRDAAGKVQVSTNSESVARDFEQTTRLAELSRTGGHLEEATALYRRAVDFRSDWQEGWRQLGTLLYMQARYPQAISALQRAVSLDSKQPDTWTLLGLSEFETKDYKNSLVHLEHGRALGFSGNANAVRVSRYHLALLLNLNSEFDRAIALLTPEAGSGTLSDEIQFAMGIALLRIPSLPEQIDEARRPLVREAGEAAMSLSRSYYDKAFAILESMLSEHPQTPFLHYAYGDALASVSRYDEAQAQLREETRLNPKSELAFSRLASIDLILHDSTSAMAEAEKAIAIAPESAEAHYLMGRAFLDEANSPAAIRELDAARHLAPYSPKVHFNLARAYAQANRPIEAGRERAEFERLRGGIEASSATRGGEDMVGSESKIQPPAQ